MKQALIFSLKLWLTSALLGPILYLFPYEHFHGNDQESGFIFLWVPIAIVVGSLFALAYSAIFSFVIHRLRRSLIKLKSILSILAVLLIIVTIGIWYKWWIAETDLYQMALAYAIVGLASIWFYKLEPVTQEPKETARTL